MLVRQSIRPNHTMINLLPTTEKRVIRVRYRLRRTTVAFLLAGAILFVLMLMALPSYFATTYGVPQDALGQTPTLSAFAEKQEQVRVANEKISALMSGQEKQVNVPLPPTDAIAVVLVAKDATVDGRLGSISVHSFAYEWKQGLKGVAKKTPVALVVRGVAGTRDALRAFVATLEADPATATVDSPVENFLLDKEAPFLITVTLKAL